jgi:light-regulated signal transduction histidine kinase (bacteriophytochrome)
MNIISSDTTGGKMIRTLLIGVILFLIGMIELQYIAVQFGYIEAQFGIVISSIISIILISFSLLRIAVDLGNEDIRRRQAEENIHLINEKLVKRSAELEASNKELEQFAYITSHDLQEPLKTISNYTGIIYKKYKDTLDKNTRTYLEFLIQATIRLKTLINDILQYSRIERNVIFEKTDCNQIVKEVLEDLATPITESNAKIEVGTLPVIFCSKDIKQVFQNLIGNAIKYRNPATEPTVKVRGYPQAGNWLFEVQDNGIGIEKEYHERIFGLFQKLHPKHRYEGSGIGLAICKKVVEIHGGKIWLESEPGKGTTFYFTISKTIKNEQ